MLRFNRRTDLKGWILLLAGCVAGMQSAGADAQGVLVEHGIYTVRMLGRRVGTEEYAVRQRPEGGLAVTDVWRVMNRGQAENVSTSLDVLPGYAALRLSQTGGPRGARGVVADGGSARVSEVEGSLQVAGKGVAVFGATPAALQMVMMRYWSGHGRPTRLPVLRAQVGIRPIEIREVGHEAIYVPGAGAKGRIVRLTRFTVAGLVDEREILWMNESGRLAAIMTVADGLPVEEVLDEYEGVTGDLVHSGVRQELLDLAALGRAARPVAQGSYAISGVRLIDGTGAAAVEDATVVVRDGKVVSAGVGRAPAGMRVVRAEGETLLPGLIAGACITPGWRRGRRCWRGG